MDYTSMSDDVLFEKFRSAAIADTPGSGQREAVQRINAVKAEIRKRPGHIERYRAYLSDPDPSVRYSAALSMKTADPAAAMAVFKELDESESGISSLAIIEVWGLQKLGY